MNAIPSLTRFQPCPAQACELHRGETVSLDGDRRGMRLTCLDGQLWITQMGDAMDYLVSAGREFVVTNAGRVVIQALTPLARLREKYEKSGGKN